MDYLDKIKQIIASRGMTQKELGERVGLKRAAMSRILSGKQEPKLREAYEIARELGVTLNDLVGDDPEPGPLSGKLVRVTEDDLCLLKVARVVGVEAALARMVNPVAVRPEPPGAGPWTGR